MESILLQVMYWRHRKVLGQVEMVIQSYAALHTLSGIRQHRFLGTRVQMHSDVVDSPVADPSNWIVLVETKAREVLLKCAAADLLISSDGSGHTSASVDREMRVPIIQRQERIQYQNV